MFIAELLNKHNLFQSIQGLSDNGEVQHDISEFLFRATSAIIHIERVRELHALCLSEYGVFADELDIKRSHIVFSSANVVALVNEVPPLLNTLRIMQDMTLPMLARVGQKKFSVASSLNDAVKKLHSYPFPEAMRKRTLIYWDASGRHLKDYRDLDQHYRSVATRVLFKHSPSPQMLVLLPDNPSVKKDADFTYQEERNALHYIPTLFRSLHDWIEEFAQAMGSKPRPIQPSVEMHHLGVLAPPVGGTIALLVDHNITGGKHYLNAIEVSQLMDCRIQLRQISKEIRIEKTVT
jgi:hypothetical protein